MKKVFKSTWFKCVSVLLLIMALAGGLLAVLNDVLYVSPETRASRAMEKIYGYTPQYSVTLDVDSDDSEINEPLSYDFDSKDNKGYINKIYELEGGSGDIVFQTVGENGFKGGTITLWIKIVKNENTYAIDKIILSGYTKQTLMSNLTQSFYEGFYLTDVTSAALSGELFYADKKYDGGSLLNPVSGATKSATAVCNAVNCVIKYIGEKAL